MAMSREHSSLRRYMIVNEREIEELVRRLDAKQLRAEADCLRIFRDRVVPAQAASAAALDAIDREVAAEVERAIATAQAAPSPARAELLTDVYAQY